MNPTTPSLVFPRSPSVPVIPNQCSHWCGNPRPPSPRPQAREPFLYLPPAGYFCHQRQKYPKTPLETTLQDFLSALRPAANLPYISRALAFPVFRCPSKGLCPHSFPLPLRCRCPLPQQQSLPLPPYRGTPHPNATSLVRTVIPSQPAGWRGNPHSPKAPSGGFEQCSRCNAPHLPFAVRCTAKGAI